MRNANLVENTLYKSYCRYIDIPLQFTKFAGSIAPTYTRLIRIVLLWSVLMMDWQQGILPDSLSLHGSIVVYKSAYVLRGMGGQSIQYWGLFVLMILCLFVMIISVNCDDHNILTSGNAFIEFEKQTKKWPVYSYSTYICSSIIDTL